MESKQTKAERRARKTFRTITFIVGYFAILWSPYYVVVSFYIVICKFLQPYMDFVSSVYLHYYIHSSYVLF
ncbi:unnamed protein product [Brugia timori]|uniref:G_PROTEIN_RECEP_F1_2 domain-containing protein n=1 Tax=Brugia timori TaxID=42155 RepID=A0A0R3Q8N0_9BILA|nr:unnamed protein product [Brugia timori]